MAMEIVDFPIKDGDFLVVGGLEHFFVHVLGIIIPTDELIFFRGVAQPPTSYSDLIWFNGIIMGLQRDYNRIIHSGLKGFDVICEPLPPNPRKHGACRG
jgi:hypothetical protein